MDYQNFIPNRLAPSWLQGPKGKAWLMAMGNLLDSLSDRGAQSVTARFPTMSPSDALSILGAERNILRYATDTDATYAARIINAWEINQWAGTPFAILCCFFDMGYKYFHIMTQSERGFYFNNLREFQHYAIPDGWTVDSTTDFWSKFQVVWTDPSSFKPDWFTQVYFTGTGYEHYVEHVNSLGLTADTDIYIDITSNGLPGVATCELTVNSTTYTAVTTPVARTCTLVDFGHPSDTSTEITLSFDMTKPLVSGDMYYALGTKEIGRSTLYEAFKNIIATWKSGHSIDCGIVFRVGGELWGTPTGTWGDGYTTWGSGAATYWR